MEAAECFMNGYSCSESIVKWAIDKNIVSEDLLSVASSFSGGMGSGCLCGAIAGSQMVLGAVYGKENKHGNPPFARAKAQEFIQTFTAIHKATCCRVLTKGLEMGSSERKLHCVNMVESAQKILEELLSGVIV